MPDQLSLPGLDTDDRLFRPDVIPDPDGKLQRYTLFLATFPGEEDSARLAHAAAEVRDVHALRGALLSAGQLHITLHTLASFHSTIPQSIVYAAIAASASVICAPLPIVFDHVLSFVKSNAFVLRCDAVSDAGISRLRQSLALALRRVALDPALRHATHDTVVRHSPRCRARDRTDPLDCAALCAGVEPCGSRPPPVHRRVGID